MVWDHCFGTFHQPRAPLGPIGIEAIRSPISTANNWFTRSARTPEPGAITCRPSATPFAHTSMRNCRRPGVRCMGASATAASGISNGPTSSGRRRPTNTFAYTCICWPGRCEAGQLLRIVGVVKKTPFGLVPTGNTGGADVSQAAADPCRLGPDNSRCAGGIGQGSLRTLPPLAKSTRNSTSSRRTEVGADALLPPGVRQVALYPKLCPSMPN